MADTTTTAPVSPEELEKERKTLWAILKEWLDNLLNDKKAVKLFGELNHFTKNFFIAVSIFINSISHILHLFFKLTK